MMANGRTLSKREADQRDSQRFSVQELKLFRVSKP
jgi:hypothetical protein